MVQTLKVAFIGTACSGKTTLLERCRVSFGDAADYLEEVARAYFSVNVVDDRMSPQVQGTIMRIIRRRERELMESTNRQLLFCDRSVVDAPIYVSASGARMEAVALFNEIEAWIATYDKLFLADPSDIPYRRDEIRTESVEVRDRIHNEFRSFLTDNAIPFELLSGSVDARVATVATVVKSLAAENRVIDVPELPSSGASAREHQE